MHLRCFRRVRDIEDPFAEYGIDWPAKTIRIIPWVFLGGGVLMSLAGILYCIFGYPTPAMRYQWPMWGGVLMFICGIPLTFLAALCLRPFSARRERRVEERRRRRDELYNSNRVMAPLPIATNVFLPTIPPPVVMPEVFRGQGSSEAPARVDDILMVVENQSDDDPGVGPPAKLPKRTTNENVKNNPIGQSVED